MLAIKEINAQELAAGEQDQYQLVDIRSHAEVAQGMIPGARHIPMNDLPRVIQELAGAQPVVLYCRSGARSSQACIYLNSQGLDNIVNLRGGIIAWAKSGYEIIAGT